MTPFNTNTRPLSVLLHAILGSVAAIGISTALLNPPSLRADVAKGSEKPKKDPDDKKKEKKTDYLPEARAAIGRFLVGGSVDIELVASVGTSRRVEFVVRQAPKCGTLSLIRPDLTEGHKARVTYTHDGGGAPLSDSFTYACRLEGGSWSAPETVTLVGERLEPKIEVVNLPLFSRVFLGGEASAQVILRNVGSADFSSELQWPEPYSGPPSLQVPRGGVVEFTVNARPTKTGDFRHEIFFQPGVQQSRAIFYVVCVQALSVSPSRLALVLDGKDGERSGVLSLANARPQPVRVVMKHPARLLAPEETEVAGGSRSDLRIALPAGDVESFSGEVVVVAGDDVQKVTVTAEPKPAVLQMLVPASLALDFGVVPQRTLQSREVVISNAGGATLIVAARVRPPYSLGEPVKSLRLEPREQARLKVSLQTDRVGPAPGQLDLESNSTHMSVTLTADVHETESVEAPQSPSKLTATPGASPSPAALASAGLVAQPSPAAAHTAYWNSTPGSPPPKGGLFPQRSIVQSVLMAVAASKGAPIPASLIDPYLPSINSIEFISATPSEITIAWPKPAVIPPGWMIEISSQVVESKTGMFIKVWTRYRDWETVEIDGDRIAVRLKNLQPASLYEVRVLAVNREGKVSEPAATRLVQTGLPWRMPTFVWSIMIAAVLAVIAYRLYRMRQGGFSLASA